MVTGKIAAREADHLAANNYRLLAKASYFLAAAQPAARFDIKDPARLEATRHRGGPAVQVELLRALWLYSSLADSVPRSLREGTIRP